MEPTFNNPATANNEPAPSNPYPSQESVVTASDVKDVQQEAPVQNTNELIIEELKEQRDKLRGINDNSISFEEKPKHSKLKILLMLVIFGALIGSTYFLIVKPRLDKPQESAVENNAQKSFVLPSNLASKTSEEKVALNVIELARKNDAETLVTTYLNRAQLGQSEADFKALVNSYSTYANGENVELVEKTVGKVDFASTGESSAIAETTAEFEAASLIYKSGYYRHTNNLYLKINLYKPDPTVDTWKMYVFEFKAGDGSSPLKADVHIPV